MIDYFCLRREVRGYFRIVEY